MGTDRSKSLLSFIHLDYMGIVQAGVCNSPIGWQLNTMA